MMKCNVRTIHDAFAYITDCNLATVADMAMLKKKRKNEFKRQINIAQTMVDWCKEFDCDYSSTRADEVINVFSGSVEKWAMKY